VIVHTGVAAPEWAGHRIGRYVSAQGNILEGPEVVEGDRPGMQSAAMLIVKEDGGAWLNNDVVLRLQVDDHERPIEELRRLVEMAAERRGGPS